MSAQPTPGPWAVRQAHGGGKYHHITGAAVDGVACFRRFEDADFVVRLVNGGKEPEKQSEQLVKELLGLAVLSEASTTLREQQQIERGERYEHSCYLKNLRAAIAKATAAPAQQEEGTKS